MGYALAMAFGLYLHSDNATKDGILTFLQDRRLVVVSGPSGVGKGTLISRLVERYPGIFATTVSHTTRQPRPDEVDGKQYHFVTREQFRLLVQKDAFVEHNVFTVDYYGTSKQTIKDLQVKGKIVILDIERNGLNKIKDSGLDVRSVFISPPSVDALKTRLEARGTDSLVGIQRRISAATVEMRNSGVYDKVIINDDLDKAYREFEAWMLGR